MFCIGIVGTYVCLLLLLGSGYGFGIPLRHETQRTTEPGRRPTGEERMG